MTEPEDWRPDWRDAQAYPAPADLSPYRWAWELLRRNADYAAFHAEVGAAWQARHRAPGGAYADLPEDVAVAFGLAASSWLPAPADEVPEAFALGPGPVPRLIFRNPFTAEDEPVAAAELALAETETQAQVAGMQGEGRAPPRFQAVTFRLDLGLDEQWAALKPWLERLQADAGVPLRRLRLDKLPAYLRLLDAEAAGASRKAMAAALYPEAFAAESLGALLDRTRKQLTAARALRDHDYRALAFLPEHPARLA